MGEAAASAPSAEPRLGRIELPTIVPMISDHAKNASRRERAQLQTGAAVASAAAEPASSGKSEPASSGKSGPGTAAAAAPWPARGGAGAAGAGATGSVAAAPAAASASQPSFALSTRPLRTRAEAEQVMAAMTALLRSPGAGKLYTDILPEGADWRVVGWPFSRRGDADLARELLLARGMRVEVIRF